jgi:hypothetical protein
MVRIYYALSIPKSIPKFTLGFTYQTKNSNQNRTFLQNFGSRYSRDFSGIRLQKQSDTDLKGEHFLNCSSGGARLKMHNLILQEIVMLAKSIGAKVKITNLNHLFSLADSESSPDIQISQCPTLLAKFNPSHPPNSIFGDIRIVHPACKSYCIHASSTPFYAANKEYISKQQKFSHNMSLCQPNGLFIPLILESFGAIHPNFREILAALVPELAMKMVIKKKVTTSRARFTLDTANTHGYP